MAKRDPYKTPTPDAEPDETNETNGETNGDATETTAPVEETPPPTAKTKPTPPATRIGLADTDPPTYVENPGGAERTYRVQIGAGTYEHTGEDADGVWLYRPVK